MRQARLKAPEHHPVAYYHCISRVVDRRFVLGDAEREQFVAWMRHYEAFCGVRIITYCVMSNHFHILVEVPQRPVELPSDEVLFGLLERGYSKGFAQTIRQRLEMLPEDERQALRESFFARMWDVSAFMKLLKQRFTQWFNRQQGRKGTLWEERFKSVLVDGAGEALATMAAYIDLNPVRAGLVNDPKDFRWCGYAEAVAGKRVARQGLQTVITAAQRAEGTLSEALDSYRVRLFGQGAQEGVNQPGEAPTVRRGIDPERVKAVVAEKGKLTVAEYLRCRVRYFADGAVLGTRAYVDDVFQQNRERFGPKRKDGARKLRHLQSNALFSLRDLRLSPVTAG
jgi:REP element-mobilizing transposase RayT